MEQYRAGIPSECIVSSLGSGGVARTSLNHRLMAGKPPACGPPLRRRLAGMRRSPESCRPDNRGGAPLKAKIAPTDGGGYLGMNLKSARNTRRFGRNGRRRRERSGHVGISPAPLLNLMAMGQGAGQSQPPAVPVQQKSRNLFPAFLPHSTLRTTLKLHSMRRRRFAPVNHTRSDYCVFASSTS